MYQHTPYPKALYHQTEPACLVPDAAAHAALGPGWSEEPYSADAQPPAEPPPSGPPAQDPPALAPSDEPPAQAEAEQKALYAADEAVLIEKLAASSLETLERVKGYEKANPAGARKPLLKAVDARIKTLKAEAKKK